MSAWRTILDGLGDSDSWGSRLAVTAHFLLLFAMVGARVAIMCCILQALWHVVDFVLFFTVNMAHGQFSIVFYNQSEASVGFSCFLQLFVVPSHSVGSQIAGTRDLKSRWLRHSNLQWFNPQYACETPVRLLFFIMPADPHEVTFCFVAGQAASWKASMPYSRGLCFWNRFFLRFGCDSIAIQQRSESPTAKRLFYNASDANQLPLAVNHATQSRSNDCKIQCNLYWLQPFAKKNRRDLAASWNRDNAIWIFWVGVVGGRCDLNQDWAIWRVCLQPSQWFLAIWILRFGIAIRIARFCVASWAHAKLNTYEWLNTYAMKLIPFVFSYRETHSL